jgi:peptide/nickel transport system permease protein
MMSPAEAAARPDVSSVTSAETPPPARKRSTGLLVASVVFVAGAVLLWLFLVPWGRLDGVVKVPGIVAAIVLMFRGYSSAGRAVWGPQWDPGFWLSCAWLVALSLGAILADVLPLAEHVDIAKSLSEPGNARPDLFSRHPLGTNNLSLDLLARSLYGARVSLLTSFLAVAIGLVVGGSIGLAAGFLRGRFDRVVGVFTDATLAFPGLILLIALAAMLGTPETPAEAVLKSGVALAIVGLPIMVRLARSQTLTFAQREFVLASKGLGATKRRIMFSELAPNIAPPLLSYSLVLTAVLIVAEGSLAFLGLGLAQPQPTWGNMIAEGGLTTLTDYPHIPLVPGAFMFLTVLSLNRVGEWATARWGQRESQL